MTVICAKKLEGCKKKSASTEKNGPTWPHLSFRTAQSTAKFDLSWLTLGVKAIKPIVQKYSWQKSNKK